jgi:two-component system nitrate/nitrite response regulator NarL
LKSQTSSLLIVEDQHYIRDKIKEEVLKMDMYGVVHESDTLQEALKIINGEAIDTIILDLSLPDGSGLEILSYLKEKNLGKRVFVFSASPEMKNVSIRYGANYFFDKKNGLDPLIEMLRNDTTI